MWGSITTTATSEPPKSEYIKASYSAASYSTDLRIPKITFATTTMPEPSKSEYSKALYSTAFHSTDLKIPNITFKATIGVVIFKITQQNGEKSYRITFKAHINRVSIPIMK